MRLDASVQTLLNEGDDQKAYYDEIRALFGSDEIGVVGVLADDVYQPAALTKIRSSPTGSRRSTASRRS